MFKGKKYNNIIGSSRVTGILRRHGNLCRALGLATRIISISPPRIWKSSPKLSLFCVKLTFLQEMKMEYWSHLDNDDVHCLFIYTTKILRNFINWLADLSQSLGNPFPFHFYSLHDFHFYSLRLNKGGRLYILSTSIPFSMCASHFSAYEIQKDEQIQLVF